MTIYLGPVLRIFGLSSGAHHLAKLKLLSELTAQDTQVADEFVAGSDDGIFGGEGPIGLDSKVELVLEWVRDLADRIRMKRRDIG